MNIARSFKISKQAVSRALITMNKQIEKTLLEMARAKQIEMERVNSEYGLITQCRLIPAPLFLYLLGTGCRYGTSMKETALNAADMHSALNCCGTLLMR